MALAVPTLLLAGGKVCAARPELIAVVGADPRRHADALRALRDKFGDVPAIQGAPGPSARRRATAYLALGPDALQAALQAHLDAPIVSLFTSRQTYERSLASAPSGVLATAILAEPDPEHQMRLIHALYRRSVEVGALLSPSTAHTEASLQAAATSNGLRLRTVRVTAGASITRSLNLLDTVSVIIIQPDSDLYTQATLRELLESTYRRRLPVIGFSSALVAAGTLASAYSSADDTVSQLERMLGSIDARRLPVARYPAYWRVAINDSVARSLDIVVDDAVRAMGDRP